MAAEPMPNPAQEPTERIARNPAQEPTERIVGSPAPAPEAAPSPRETPPPVQGGWGEGKSLREAERNIAEQGSEALLGKKIELDAEVQKESSLFKETLSSWWAKTKRVFGGAKSFVTNEKNIQALDARLETLKSGYQKKAEEAVVPSGVIDPAAERAARGLPPAKTPAVPVVPDLNEILTGSPAAAQERPNDVAAAKNELRRLEAEYERLALEVAQEGADDAMVQKALLAGKISPEDVPVSEAGRKLNETLQEINALKARMARGETGGTPVNARTKRIADMGQRVDAAMAAEDAIDHALDEAEAAEAPPAPSESATEKRAVEMLEQAREEEERRRAQFEAESGELAKDLERGKLAKLGVTIRRTIDKKGDEVIGLTNPKPKGVVSGETEAKNTPPAEVSAPSVVVDQAYLDETKEGRMKKMAGRVDEAMAKEDTQRQDEMAKRVDKEMRIADMAERVDELMAGQDELKDDASKAEAETVDAEAALKDAVQALRDWDEGPSGYLGELKGFDAMRPEEISKYEVSQLLNTLSMKKEALRRVTEAMQKNPESSVERLLGQAVRDGAITQAQVDAIGKDRALAKELLRAYATILEETVRTARRVIDKFPPGEVERMAFVAKRADAEFERALATGGKSGMEAYLAIFQAELDAMTSAKEGAPPSEAAGNVSPLPLQETSPAQKDAVENPILKKLEAAADGYALKLSMENKLALPKAIKDVRAMNAEAFVRFLREKKLLQKKESSTLAGDEEAVMALRDVVVRRLEAARK